jgi:hypothetical protein
MKAGRLLFLAASMLLAWPLLAQDFSGRFVLGTGAETAVVTLEPKGDRYAGTLSLGGLEAPLDGVLINGHLQGLVEAAGQKIGFQAELKDALLLLTLVQLDANNQPIQASAQTLPFQRD